MITFAAIVPHSPLLLPTIGKENRNKLKKTLAAFTALAENLCEARAETVVIFSPHGTPTSGAFPIFIAREHKVNLNEFGDFETVRTFKSDAATSEALRRLRLGQNPAPLTSHTDDHLDYGSAVPLVLLCARLPNIAVVPIGTSSADISGHVKIGERIGEALASSARRIALLASAELSQTLTDNSPGGFSPVGKKFDAALVRSLRRADRMAVLKLEPMMNEAKACGLRPIAMLLGALADISCTAEPLCYEGPFGVGYLTARFNFR